jgi:ParB/RepB/Spo0J family partition protein
LNEYKEIDIELIDPPLFVLRSKMELEREFVESVKSDMIHPIVVRLKNDGRYEVVAGHRRYLAAKKLGRKTIACSIRELDDQQALALAIAENSQRIDVRPMELARAVIKFRTMKPEGKDSLRHLAKELKISHSHLSHLLGVYDEPDLKERVENGQISLNDAIRDLNARRGKQVELSDDGGSKNRFNCKWGRHAYEGMPANVFACPEHFSILDKLFNAWIHSGRPKLDGSGVAIKISASQVVTSNHSPENLALKRDGPETAKSSVIEGRQKPRVGE